MSLSLGDRESWNMILKMLCHCLQEGDSKFYGQKEKCSLPIVLCGLFMVEVFLKCFRLSLSCEKAAAVAPAKSFQVCPTLCDPIDGSPPGSPVPGILQARTRVGRHFLLQYRKVKSESEVTQSCLTLRDPMDCSPPGPSVHRILQARVLEWGAIAFSACEQELAPKQYEHGQDEPWESQPG